MFTLLKLPSRELVSPDEEVYMSESRADRIARLSAVLPDKTVEQLENLTKEQDEKFIDAKDLPADFVAAVKRIGFESASMKINIALSAPPNFTALPSNGTQHTSNAAT